MRFVVLGAGGFAKEVIDLLELIGHEAVACFQEAGSEPARGHHSRRVPLVGSLRDVEYDAATIAVGDPAVRMRFADLVPDDSKLPALVHPSASVSPHATLGAGSLVMQNVVVSADACIERAALLNVGTYVAHDCSVGSYSHLAASTQLGGGCQVGTLCEIGTGTVILPGVRLGDRCHTGAGAVVTRDVGDGATVVGVPAKPLGRS